MSTVIKNKVHTAKKWHQCDSCGRHIMPGFKYRRLYGTAHESDPMTELKLCSGCSDLEEKNDGHSDMMYGG